VDFNPVADRLRVVSGTGQNLRIDPNTGTATAETPLAYEAGDPNFGKNPKVVSAAYNNNFPGATQTTLFDIDFKRDVVVMQGGVNGTPPPGGGQLFTIGSLGFDTSDKVGFDIDSGGNAYASLTQPNKNSSNFFSVNVSTGAATQIGKIGGGQIVRDLAVVLNSYTVYAVAGTNQLMQFNSDTPGLIDSMKPILGLELGELIVGLDTRPSTGELFAMGLTEASGRIYTINPATGQATQVGSAPFSDSLTGSSFGFDFNPVVDLIRVVSNDEENLRINPNTGGLVNADVDLSPAGEVTSSAHNRNFGGTSVTTLFGIDTSSNMLVRQGGVDGNPTPNDGAITNIGALNVDPSAVSGFDIATGSDTALAALTVSGTPGLYGINLTTGAAALIGIIGDGSPVIRAMAIATPTVQFSAPTYTKKENASFAEVVVTRTGGSRGVVTVHFATSDGSATSGSDYGLVEQTLIFADGETRKTIQIPLFDDTQVEGNESVNLTLSNATGAVVLGLQDDAVLTVLDND
jgi:hypothetical protein